MLLSFCSFSIAFSCSLLAPSPFSSGARKKRKWQKKKQWVQRDFNAIFFCMPPVSRFCAGARSWRVFFSWFFSFLCLCMKMKTKWQILSILFVQLSMYVVCACVGVFFFNKCFLYKFHGMQVSRKLVVQVFGIEVRTVGRKKEERCDWLSRSTFEATAKVVCASLLKDSILVYLRSCLGSDFVLQFFPVPSPLLFTCFNGTIRQRARFENFETAPFLKVRPGQTIHVSLALHDWCPASVEACIGAILFFPSFHISPFGQLFMFLLHLSTVMSQTIIFFSCGGL